MAYFSILKMEATCSFETFLTFTELHRVISQKVELFIITAVTTSNPTTDEFFGKN
jgi:hypothetical protein